MHKLILLTAAILLIPTVVHAQRFLATKNGKEVVAHTRRVPVLIHKVLPPYGLGLHVYARRID